jgi:NADPH:quinone reductase-like Zn-dependent oxidoreductase
MPFIPGKEAVGVVEAVGREVRDIRVGERVAASLDAGGYAQYVCAEAWRCIPVPDGVPPDAAVCLIVNYWTAFHLLHRSVHAGAGQTVLIHGASGGLGTALLQLGRLAGLTMYGLASAGKHALVRAWGGLPIDYRSEDFEARVRQMQPDGLDYVFDSIGGRTWAGSYRLLKRGGTLLICGLRVTERRDMLGIAPHALRLLPRALLPDGRQVNIAFLNLATLQASYREDLPTLLALLAEGKIEPVIGARLPLAEAAQAHRLLESGAVTGKIVLLPGG